MSPREKLKGFYYGYDPKGEAEPNCYWRNDVERVLNEYENQIMQLKEELSKLKEKGV